ncbi:MAG TPA: nuclear transport factor 2 family protein [Solirubrobacterales bacterium]|jgi:ketosteroid isomerase-like protein|nr:nuclear transport factor 2 family protein [Solirubrobacterales bacterium]
MPDADPEIEVVLAAYDAFARGDAAAATADMDPEVEWIEPISFLNGGRRVGPAAVAEYLEASRAGWKHLTSEPTAHRVGPEIVVVHHLQGILLDGTPHEAEVADVFRFREGRIGRMRAYEAPEEAFAAAPLRRWIDAYAAAWGSNEPEAIAALFTPDGVYRAEPWVTWTGRKEIVAGWLEHADAPGDAEFRWWHLARDGDLWIVEARTAYPKVGRDYANLWLVELDEEGRARGFAEWWKQLPEAR